MNLIELFLNLISNLKKLLCNSIKFSTNNSETDGNIKNDGKKNNNYIHTNSEENVIPYRYSKNASPTISISSPPSENESKKCTTPAWQTMDGNAFKIHGKQVIDYIAEYYETIGERKVTPNVQPGYLFPLLPDEAPMYPEKFQDIMNDFDTKIMKGMVHWNHPRFYAYFPSCGSFPSLIGDMLSDMTNVIGFSWASGPSCTELEIVVIDWFAKALGLPQKFLSTSGTGGGVLEGSASDAILVVMLAARFSALEELKKKKGLDDDRQSELLPLLVAYCSKESHSCVEKAAKICLVKLRALDTNDDGRVTAETLEQAISEDEAKGLTPFMYCSILGSTSQTAFDNLSELGPVCKKRKNFWFHVDGAYAGNAFICPEMRYLMEGIEYADSFNVNPNKWFLTHFDASVLWVADKIKLSKGLIVDPIYLQHEHDHGGLIDRRHMQIPLSRRFRALKLWFVFRMYGITGIQEFIRGHIKYAKYFESLVVKDDRFEVSNTVRTGLVCFRLKGGNVLTENLLANINHSGELHMIPTKIKDKYVIRFCVNYESPTFEEIDTAWRIIQEKASDILSLVPQNKKTPLHRRLSFTRSISKEDFNKRSSSLYDGATPILVVEEDGEEHNLFDDVFVNSLQLKDQANNNNELSKENNNETT